MQGSHLKNGGRPWEWGYRQAGWNYIHNIYSQLCCSYGIWKWAWSAVQMDQLTVVALCEVTAAKHEWWGTTQTCTTTSNEQSQLKEQLYMHGQSSQIFQPNSATIMSEEWQCRWKSCNIFECMTKAFWKISLDFWETVHIPLKLDIPNNYFCILMTPEAIPKALHHDLFCPIYSTLDVT